MNLNPVFIMLALVLGSAACTPTESGDSDTNDAYGGQATDQGGQSGGDLGQDAAMDGPFDAGIKDLGPTDGQPMAEDSSPDPDIGQPPDGALAPVADADLCPPRATRAQPMVVDRFEDGSPEVEVMADGYRVIAPDGHGALAQHTLAVLPSCHEAIAAEMGYCHPWREAIVHYGRFEPSRAKAEFGVVYMGRSEAALLRLDDPDVWQEPPALCGGQTTLAHESVHTFQPPDLPAWLKEGWADYFGKIIVGGSTYECGATSLCIRPPNPGGRPQPEACPNPMEYWDLSDPDWGVRPDPDDEGGASGQSNKDRYYKTGTCFWQSIREVYGPDVLRVIFRRMHLEPRDDVPIFPFSPETNDLLMRTYFVPITGPEVWALVAPYGVVPAP